MRRLNSAAVLQALALLSDPTLLHRFPVERHDELLAGARHLVERYGSRVSANVHPAELERRARQRRRACQTHPGKRDA